MDTELLVDDRREDGYRLQNELRKSNFDVTLMFWVLTKEEKFWRLYIVSKSVDPKRIGDAYVPVHESLVRISPRCVDLLEIRIIHVSNPIARQLLELRDRYKTRMLINYPTSDIAGLAVDAIFIYPSLPELNELEDKQPIPPKENYSGSESAIIAVQQEDGSYVALRGTMHYVDGRLVSVGLQNGRQWPAAGSPIAPTIIHVFSDVRPRSEDAVVNPKRCVGWIKRLFFADGLLVGTESLGTFEVDISAILGVGKETDPKVTVAWGESKSPKPSAASEPAILSPG